MLSQWWQAGVRLPSHRRFLGAASLLSLPACRREREREKAAANLVSTTSRKARSRLSATALFLRLGRFVEALDLCIDPQLGDEIHLRLARGELFDLAPNLVKRRRLAHALILDLENMPAELGLDRSRHLALLQSESDLGEFRHHLVAGKVAEVPAILLAGRVFRQRFGERSEILALFDALDGAFHLVLGCLAGGLVVRVVDPEQNVAGADFLLAAHRLRGVLI